jgi:hypothetical protein
MTKKTQTLIHKTLHLHPYLFLLIEDWATRIPQKKLWVNSDPPEMLSM